MSLQRSEERKKTEEVRKLDNEEDVKDDDISEAEAEFSDQEETDFTDSGSDNSIHEEDEPRVIVQKTAGVDGDELLFVPTRKYRALLSEDEEDDVEIKSEIQCIDSVTDSNIEEGSMGPLVLTNTMDG